jgi:hypothetical protein
VLVVKFPFLIATIEESHDSLCVKNFHKTNSYMERELFRENNEELL